MNIAAGTLTGIFSYDVGYEIALDGFARLLEPLGATTRRTDSGPAGIRGAGRTVDLELGKRTVRLPDGEAQASVVVRAHDFGALSVMLGLPLSGPLEALGALTAALVR